MFLPNNFEQLTNLLYNAFRFKNILIINTTITGLFLDNIFLDKKPIRIKYNPYQFDKFIKVIGNINQKFDLILVDPYHEYRQSILTYIFLINLLDENGILISHDCSPPNFMCTYPLYKKGEWCGVTYAAFIEISYNNPNLYYAVINKDYGLGIISKKEIELVKKIFDNKKQQIFLDLFKNNKYKQAYDYFREYSNDIINLIN